jgi:hypothetical protein
MQDMQEFASQAMEGYIHTLAQHNNCSMAEARRDVLSRMTPNGSLSIKAIKTKYVLECEDEKLSTRPLVWNVGTILEFNKDAIEDVMVHCTAMAGMISRADDETILRAAEKLIESPLTNSDDPDKIRDAMSAAVLMDMGFVQHMQRFDGCKIMNLHYGSEERIPGWCMAWVCLFRNHDEKRMKAMTYLVRVELLTNLMLSHATSINMA